MSIGALLELHKRKYVVLKSIHVCVNDDKATIDVLFGDGKILEYSELWISVKSNTAIY